MVIFVESLKIVYYLNPPAKPEDAEMNKELKESNV